MTAACAMPRPAAWTRPRIRTVPLVRGTGTTVPEHRPLRDKVGGELYSTRRARPSCFETHARVDGGRSRRCIRVFPVVSGTNSLAMANVNTCAGSSTVTDTPPIGLRLRARPVLCVPLEWARPSCTRRRGVPEGTPQLRMLRQHRVRRRPAARCEQIEARHRDEGQQECRHEPANDDRGHRPLNVRADAAGRSPQAPSRAARRGSAGSSGPCGRGPPRRRHPPR